MSGILDKERIIAGPGFNKLKSTFNEINKIR